MKINLDMRFLAKFCKISIAKPYHQTVITITYSPMRTHHLRFIQNTIKSSRPTLLNLNHRKWNRQETFSDFLQLLKKCLDAT